MSNTRIYKLTPTDPKSGLKERYIDATQQGTAIKHATRGLFTIKVASGKDVADAIRAGKEIEVAAQEQLELEASKDE